MFEGSIPGVYEKYLVPMIFDPYADDLASRVAAQPCERVLEIAAGTGAATRKLARALPDSTSLVATDLNEPMLEVASVAIGATRAIEWRSADVMQLPFDDASFDTVACQFGVMFFPDKARAFSEVRRVLKPGGRFVFSTWDCIEENDFADAVNDAVESLFPADPPRFMARLPHGYFHRRTIERDLGNGGFGKADVEVVTHRSHADSPRTPAFAFCQGTPLRGEIEARNPLQLAEATDVATDMLAKRFGNGAIDGKMQAFVISVEK